MAFDIQAAKQAGYSDEEINAYLQAKPETKTLAPVAPGQEQDPGEPPPPPPAEGYKQAGEGNYMPAIGTAAAAAAPYAIPAAATGAGLYGAAKVGGWGRDVLTTAREGMEAYRTGVNTANEIAQRNVALQQARMAERAARGGQAVQQAAQGGQQAFQQMGQQLSQARPAGPVAPQPAPVAQAAPAQQPGIIQRATDTASKIRQLAAQRVAGFGTGAAGVPAAVGAGGAVATGIAGGQMAAMTPEQRKAYYDNMMLGAMGGDAALGAAIMNRGQ